MSNEIKKQLIESINLNTAALIKLVDATPVDQYNVHEEGRWSVGDVMGHLIKTEEAVLGVLNGDVKPLKGRPVDDRVGKIETAFGNMEIKLTAPEPLAPLDGVHNPQEQKEAFNAIRTNIILTVENEDLEPVCLGFKHRFFGNLTRYEWVRFVALHATRHARQIESLIH